MTQKGEIERTSPDHIFVQGILTSGALASLAYRTVPTEQVEDEVGLKWTITGTEGEIVITARNGHWQMLESDSLVFKMRKGKGEVQVVDFGVGTGEKEEVLAVDGGERSGRNVARVYEAVLNGRTEEYATFEQALESQKLLGKIREVAGK
jgi:hypothetical protein